MLLVWAELANFVDDGGTQGQARELAMAAQGFDETLFSKFFASRAERLGDAIGVEGEDVAGRELAFGEGTIPILESAHDGCGGWEPLEGIIGMQEQGRKVATVGVAEAARGAVIFGEEKSGKGGVGSVLAEELVDGA